MKAVTLLIGSALAWKGISWLLKALSQDEPEHDASEHSPPQISPPVSYGASSRNAYTYGHPSSGHSQGSIVNQTPSEHSSRYQPLRQPSTPYAPHTPLQPRDASEPSSPQISPPVSYGTSSRNAYTYGHPSRGHSQGSIVNQTSSEHSSRHQPLRQPSTPYAPHTPLQPRDALVAIPPNHIQHPVDTLAPEEVVAPLVIDQHEDPESLRLKARREGDNMAECFSKSKQAFNRNEKRRAKELSLMGQAHKENMMRLDREASAKIFQENNRNVGPNTVDLHGLYVQEAKSYFESEVVQNIWNRAQPLRVIVGKGNHSNLNIPKIKPAIQALGQSLGMSVDVDPVNDGCLIMNSTPGSRSWADLVPQESQSVYYE